MRPTPYLILAALVALFTPHAGAEERNRQVLVVFDGLRPDYVTRELMPRLAEFASRGVFFEKHHAVFPTVTRVNASSISTGCYPAKHGIMGNSVYFPELDPVAGLNTGDRSNLEAIDKATGGKLLTRPTLGELLDQAGLKLLAISAGSTGSAFLLNPRVAGAGIIHNEYALPESLAERARAVLGGPAPDGYPADAMNGRVVDGYLNLGVDEIKSDVTVLWFTDPDHTAHKLGIGAPQMVESLRLVDAQFGRLLDGLKQRGLHKRTNIFVTSDHGFSTHTGKENIAGLLIQAGLKEGPRSQDVVIVEGAIYVKDHDRDKIRAIVERLQATSWVGAIFTRRGIPGHPEGFIPGTLALESARWNHARAADILVSADWNDEANEAGYKGKTTQGGVAGHGTSSPWDIHNTLIAAGPDVKRKLRNPVPSGNVDLAPTLLHLCGVTPPDGMDGRVLREALKGGPKPSEVKVQERSIKVFIQHPQVRYEIELFESQVGPADYLDHTRVTRTRKEQ